MARKTKAVQAEPAAIIAEGGVIVDGALMGGNERGPELVIPRGMTKAEFDTAVAAQTETVPVEAPTKRTKVAILGFVPHFAKAPFDDPSFEIWGLNELYEHIPRWDRWFELHKRELYENDRNRTSVHVNRLKAFPTNVPIYMQQAWPDIPASVPYPMAAILNAFPNPCPEARPYLTNSITYEILLAIAEGFQEIHLYGVDMAADSEYSQQRPSCEWAIGIAQGRGIKVYIPSESDLLKTLFFYGYEADQAAAFDSKLRAHKALLTKNLEAVEANIAQAIEARAQYRGALQDVDHWAKNWKSSEVPTTSS